MKPQHIIKLEYADLKVTIESFSKGSTLDAFLLGSTIIEKTQELGYVKPSFNIQVPIPKTETRES